MVLDSSKEFFKEFVCLLFETILKVHLYAKRKISDILDFWNSYNRSFALAGFEKFFFFILFSRA